MSVQNKENTTPSFAPLVPPKIKEEPAELSVSQEAQPPQLQHSPDDSEPATCEQSPHIELLQDESETPAGGHEASPNGSNKNKNSTAAASNMLARTRKTKSEELHGNTKLPSKGSKEKSNLETTERRKMQDTFEQCVKSTNDSFGSGDKEVIVLEQRDDDGSQESLVDLEPTLQLNQSDENFKETSSPAADSRPQEERSDESAASVSAGETGTNDRHETPPDWGWDDGMSMSLMTSTRDEKHRDEVSTIPENAKCGSDGELRKTPREEHNNDDDPSQGDLELMLKRKAPDGRGTAGPGSAVPSAGYEASSGTTPQLGGNPEEPGGTVKAKAMKRIKDTSSRKTPDDSNPYGCDRCGKVMSNFKNYKSHMKSHTVGKTFECSTCGKMFRERWDLNKHAVIHSTVKSFTCEVCARGFNRRYNLELHLRIHTGEKPFRCNTCDKSFRSSVNLNKHRRIHTGEKPYTCKDCGKEFSDSSAYKNHLRVHSGEKPFSCEYCLRKFATGTTLKRHTRTHTGEKPYKCNVCDKLFGRRSDLKGHSRLHTGERPYSCTVCGKRFSSWLKLNRHKNVHVKSEASTPCTQDASQDTQEATLQQL